jgi:hypothetical protein
VRKYAFLFVLLSLFSLVLPSFSMPLVIAVEDYWATLKPMPLASSGLKVAVVNDRIYAIGGNAYGIALNNNNEYDPVTDTWALKMKMPTARAFFGIAVWQNKIYCIGGRKYDGLTGVNEVYDPATDTWENKSSMPTPRFSVVANVVGEKIYVIGGAPGVKSNPTNLNEVYDPATDTWETKAPIPDPKSAYNSAVVDNKIYVIGDLTQIYDPETNIWSLGEPPPTLINGAVCATTGLHAPKRIYLLGGNLPHGNTTNLNQIYNPEDNTWTVGTPMTYDRAGLAIANVNDTLYALGGSHLRWYDTPVSPQDVAFNEHYVPLGYIPEFPSWLILSLFLTVTLVAALIKKKIDLTC